MNAIWDFFVLSFWIAPRVFWFSFQEERKIKSLFYEKKREFAQIDKAFKRRYLLKNPYRICKNYQKEKGFSLLHTYGETPISVFHSLFERGGITSNDCFVDLGCGRGRGVLFASNFWGIRSIGVERIPHFCTEAQKLASIFFCDCIFCMQDIESFDFSQGTFFYFYGLCMGEEEWNQALQQFEKIPKGSKIVTVSFPLENSIDFKVIDFWEERFPWGKTDVFLHLKTS